MRRPVMPTIENSDDLTRGIVPSFRYMVPENTPAQLAAVRRLCPADVLEILGVTA